MTPAASPSSHRTERRFVGNAAIGTMLHLASTFIVLAITPILVGRLGLEAYGLWALLNTAIRYSLLADVGLGPSLVKHVAQYVAVGDDRSIRATTTVGTFYFTLTGVLALAGVAIVGPFAAAHLPMSAALRPQANELLIALMGSVAINFSLWGGPGATLTGRGHYRHTSAINALGSVAFAIAAVAFELHGDGLLGLVVAAYVQVLVTGLVGFIVLRRENGPVFINPLGIDRALYGSILRFGGWIQLSTIAGLIIADTPAVVVGFTMGVEYVGVLDLATRLAKAVRAISYNFNNALMPAVSTLDAEADGNRVGIFVPRATRLIGLLALVSSGALIASAPFLLRVWIGPQLPHEALLLAVLATVAPAYALETMTSVASAAARGVGRPTLDTVYAATYAGISLIATLILVRLLGLEGVAIASVLGVSLASTAFFRAARGTPALRFHLLIGRWLSPAFLAVAVACGTTWFASRPFVASTESRSAALVATLAAGLFYITVLVICCRVLRVVDIHDLDGLRAVLPGRLVWLANARMTRVFFARG